MTDDSMSATARAGAQPLRVLILRQNEPFPYGWVGQEARALAGAGHDVTTIAPTGLGYESLDETLDGVRALRFRSPPPKSGLVGYLLEYGWSFWSMARLVRKVNRQHPVDVVIVPTPPDFLIALALPVRKAGAALVYDQRDPGPELFEAKFGRRGLLHRLLVAAERFACRRADVVMPHNESCAELLRRRSGADPARMFVLGVGPDPSRIFPVPERPELRRGKRYLVLWMGTMSTQEGVERVVEAADRLVHGRGRGDIAFSIVGPGDARDALLVAVRRRGLEGAVDLPGVITDPDLLRAYIATADVCVSVDERNPMNDRSTMMKVLEYMAMGRPVVQFPLHEMSQVCGDATAYARNADSDDLADQIAALLDDPERRDGLGEAARRLMSEGLMWTDQVPVLLEAIEAAVAARRGTEGMWQRARRGS